MFRFFRQLLQNYSIALPPCPLRTVHGHNAPVDLSGDDDCVLEQRQKPCDIVISAAQRLQMPIAFAAWYRIGYCQIAYVIFCQVICFPPLPPAHLRLLYPLPTQGERRAHQPPLPLPQPHHDRTWRSGLFLAQPVCRCLLDLQLFRGGRPRPAAGAQKQMARALHLRFPLLTSEKSQAQGRTIIGFSRMRRQGCTYCSIQFHVPTLIWQLRISPKAGSQSTH